MVNAHNVIVFSDEEDTHTNMDESHRQKEQKKLDTKKYILCDSVYMKFWERRISQ